MDHPFDAEENYIIKYSVNLREFYCFGSKNCYRTKYFYIARSIHFDNQVLFKELRVHKIHTKKSSKSVSVSLMKAKTQANNYQPRHQLKCLQIRMDNNKYWLRKLSEIKSTLKQDLIKKGRFFVISESILAASEALYLQPYGIITF